MPSSFDSSQPEQIPPLPLTPPSRYLSSPTPPLFGMSPDKASIISISSPASGQRSIHEFMTPRTLLANREVANSASPSPQRTHTPSSATRLTPCSPQRRHVQPVIGNVFSTPQGSRPKRPSRSKKVTSPSSEILAQLESEEENDNYGDKFKELLIEAKKTFTDKDPDFVINNPGVETRTVQIANDEVTDLVFEYWDKRGKGFWTLEFGNQRRYIVKYFNKGRHYRAWLGPEAGYEADRIAWQKGSSSSAAAARAGVSDSSTIVSEEWDASEDDATSVRELRRRSYNQMKPYTAEKRNHKLALQGKPKRREDLDYDLFQPPRSTARPISPGYANAKKRRTSSKSDTRTLTPSGTQEEATQEMVNKQTRLNTRLTTALSDLPEVVYLEDTPSVEALFDEVRQAWHSKIPGDGEVKLAVTFPWLEELDTSSILSVRQDRPRSYDRMLELINKAPCWDQGGNAECVVNVHVMIE